MANSFGTFTSVSDFFSKLSTFATTNGWTQNHSASDRLFLTNGTVSVAFRWATSSPTVAAIYHHLGFIDPGIDPGNHTDDSGNGEISSSDALLDDQRHVKITDSGGNYWFFEDATYIHAAIEYQTGYFSHLGFGILTKLGSYTGGEYCYGTKEVSSSAHKSGVQSCLLDGVKTLSATNNSDEAATIHIESLPGQPAGSKWGLTGGTDSGTTFLAAGTDRGGIARAFIQGGFRGGPDSYQYARFNGNNNSGLIPMYPISCWYVDSSTTSDWYPLGYQPDVRGINIDAFAAGDEITVGSDTWVVFPMKNRPEVDGTNNSGHCGIAYKKVT